MLAAEVMSFQDGVHPSPDYYGTRDVRIEEFDPYKNYNYSDKLEMDGAPESSSSLLSWDIRSIPADAVIQAVSITVNVIDPTNDTYELYAVRRPWEESQATWTQTDATTAWQRSGASGELDRGTEVLGVIKASSRGLVTVQLNDAGIAVVQSWLQDPSTNYGLIVQDYTEDNGLDFRSRETAIAAERPRLEVTYSVSDVPPPTEPAPEEPVTASFQDGVYPTTDYRGTEDVRISSASPTKNYNFDDELWVDGAPADVAALLRWDVSGIPTDAVVQSVSMTIQVTDGSHDGYEIYALLRPWVEAEATWQQAAAGASWQVEGAHGSQDYGTDVLGIVTASSLGSATIELTSAGIAVVQSWIQDPAVNHGFIIKDYDSASNGLDFYAREAAVPSERPKLDITYMKQQAPPPSEPSDSVEEVYFQDGLYPSPSYAGTQDVRISSNSPSKNYNYSDYLVVDGSPEMAALLRWDIASIPADAVVQSASITVNVIDPSSDQYALFELLRPWSENEASWTRASGANDWQQPGAQGDLDRGTDVLGLISSSSTGLVTLPLTAKGLEVVQRWIQDPSTNQGVIFQEYTSAANGLDFHSREAVSAGERPRLAISYSVPTTLSSSGSLSTTDSEQGDVAGASMLWSAGTTDGSIGSHEAEMPTRTTEGRVRKYDWAVAQFPRDGWGIRGIERTAPRREASAGSLADVNRTTMRSSEATGWELDEAWIAEVNRAWAAAVVRR